MRSDVLGTGALFVFGGVTVILSLQMPIGTFRAAGSGLFPLCLGVLLMALSGPSLVFAFRSPIGETGAEVPVSETKESRGPVIAFLSIVALAVLLLTTIGYAVISFLLMIGLLRALGSRNWLLNIAISLLTAVAAYMVFVLLLKIPLPMGLLGM